MKASDRVREITSQCRLCRSEAYFAKRYPKTCAICDKHRRLAQNKACDVCNDLDGLRECRRCRDLLPVKLKFHGDRKRCSDCENALRRLRRGRVR